LCSSVCNTLFIKHVFPKLLSPRNPFFWRNHSVPSVKTYNVNIHQLRTERLAIAQPLLLPVRFGSRSLVLLWPPVHQRHTRRHCDLPLCPTWPRCFLFFFECSFITRRSLPQSPRPYRNAQHAQALRRGSVAEDGRRSAQARHHMYSRRTRSNTHDPAQDPSLNNINKAQREENKNAAPSGCLHTSACWRAWSLPSKQPRNVHDKHTCSRFPNAPHSEHFNTRRDFWTCSRST
jgi:hypothetical protein